LTRRKQFDFVSWEKTRPGWRRCSCADRENSKRPPIARYRAGPNPLQWRGHLDKLLSKPSALKKLKGDHHHPAMDYVAIPAFMPELRRSRFITARALEFCILTATRTAEVLGATWDEINFTTKTWTIPASRMKAGLRGPTTARCRSAKPRAT
jgi:integrase